jgi:hypothetical protein
MKRMFSNAMLGPTEVIFLLGFFCLTIGIALLCGFAWGLIAAGSILLITAFRNAAERDGVVKREKGS